VPSVLMSSAASCPRILYACSDITATAREAAWCKFARCEAARCKFGLVAGSDAVGGVPGQRGHAGDIYLTIVLNGFIHSVMYTYYFVSMHTDKIWCVPGRARARAPACMRQAACGRLASAVPC